MLDGERRRRWVCHVAAQCDQSATSPPDCPEGRTLEYRNVLQPRNDKRNAKNPEDMIPRWHVPFAAVDGECGTQRTEQLELLLYAVLYTIL